MTQRAESSRRTGAKAERTRQAIKRATLELLRAKPLADIALADICAGAGVTQGALYFHFKNKDAAIEETLADVVERFRERLMAIERDGDFYAFLYRIVREFLPGPAWAQVLPSLQSARHASPALNDRWRALRAELATKISREAVRENTEADGGVALTRRIAIHFVNGLDAAWELAENAGASASLQKEITAVAVAGSRALLGGDPDPARVAACKESKLKPIKFIVYP